MDSRLVWRDERLDATHPRCAVFFGAGMLFPLATSGAMEPFPFLAGTAGALVGGLQNIGSGVLAWLSAMLPQTGQGSLGLLMTLMGLLIRRAGCRWRHGYRIRDRRFNVPLARLFAGRFTFRRDHRIEQGLLRRTPRSFFAVIKLSVRVYRIRNMRFFSSQAIKRANANCEATGVIFIDSPAPIRPPSLHGRSYAASEPRH